MHPMGKEKTPIPYSTYSLYIGILLKAKEKDYLENPYTVYTIFPFREQ